MELDPPCTVCCSNVSQKTANRKVPRNSINTFWCLIYHYFILCVLGITLNYIGWGGSSVDTWGMWSTLSLTLFPGPLWPVMVVRVRVPTMGQIKLFNLLQCIINYLGGARGVMVIVAGCGHGDTSLNPGPDWLHFT